MLASLGTFYVLCLVSYVEVPPLRDIYIIYSSDRRSRGLVTPFDGQGGRHRFVDALAILSLSS